MHVQSTEVHVTLTKVWCVYLSGLYLRVVCASDLCTELGIGVVWLGATEKV